MIYDGLGGIVWDFTNTGETAREIRYASLTAPNVVRCDVRLDDTLVDVVYAGAGGSHSWWGAGNGPLIPDGTLRPGQRVVVTVDGPAAFRVDLGA